MLDLEAAKAAATIGGLLIVIAGCLFTQAIVLRRQGTGSLYYRNRVLESGHAARALLSLGVGGVVLALPRLVAPSPEWGWIPPTAAAAVVISILGGIWFAYLAAGAAFSADIAQRPGE